MRRFLQFNKSLFLIDLFYVSTNFMFRYINIFLIVLVISSCVTSENSDLRRRNLKQYFVSSGVSKYFMPDLPDWANYSQTANCKRKKAVRYLHLAKLQKSFSLSYEQALQFQYMYNKDLAKTLSTFRVEYIRPQDEEIIFHKVSDKIQGKIVAFRKPKYKRVHIIWIDSFLTGKKNIVKLKKLMKSTPMGEGHPVFLSLCLTSLELDQWLQENKFSNFNIRKIPVEMFSIFNKIGNRLNKFSLNIDEIFKLSVQQQALDEKPYELFLFQEKKAVILKELIGTYKTIKF